MLFSIVVPVYNAERYLQNTVNSVLTQSFTDWELVLVNDGSTDGSLTLCRELAQRDPRIKVLSQENAGPSAARNAGVAAAQGEYIMFLDSDDEYLPGAFEAVANAIVQHAPDMVVNTMRIMRRDTKDIVADADYLLDGDVFTQETLCRTMREKRIAPGPCRYAVKRECLVGNGVRFPVGISIAEDCMWLCTLLGYIQSAAFNDALFYQYNIHSGSITNTMSYARLRDLMAVMERLFALAAESRGELKALQHNYCCILANSLLQHYNAQTVEDRRAIRAWVKEHKQAFSEALYQQPLIKAASTLLGVFGGMLLFAWAVRIKNKI